jgi:FMN phosphatase YigB (HAD superfamily)
VQPDVHLRQIDRIERLLRGNELDESAPTLPREFLEYLESRLSQIKQAAIEDYAKGRLDGDEALVGILTLVADTRHLLAQRRKQLAGASSAATHGSQRSFAAA